MAQLPDSSALSATIKIDGDNYTVFASYSPLPEDYQ
jgi:hypothetical protein